MKANQQGFTLIELLVVIAIIGILSAVAVPQYQKYVLRAEASTAVATVSAFRTAVDAAIFTENKAIDAIVAADVAGLGAAVTAEELEFENDGGTITLTAEIGNTDKNVTLSRDDEGVWSCYTDADKDSSIWNALPERCQYEVPS